MTKLTSVEKIHLDKWIKVKNQMPEEGVLCVVYLPIGENKLTGKTIGMTATAYYCKSEGWIYADTPNRLKFKPYYWQPFEV